MKMHSMNAHDGFTLIELLLVISIMGILIVAGFNTFTSSQARGRDSRRKSELRQIATALESYYSDWGSYPAVNGSYASKIMGCGANKPPNGMCDWGSAFSAGNTIYMPALGKDPVSTQYYYYSNGSSSYRLFARLENQCDIDVPKNITTNAAQVYNIPCSSSKSCNYTISSGDLSPLTPSDESPTKICN